MTTEIQKKCLLTITLTFLCGLILVPMFFVTNGTFFNIINIQDHKDEQIMWLCLIHVIMLLIGSICGIKIGYTKQNRITALNLTLIGSASIIILILIAILLVPLQYNILVVFYFGFGLIAGIMGPILLLFILEQYDSSEVYFSFPFMYCICFCYNLASFYLLYTSHLVQLPKIVLVISIICLGIGLVLLKYMKDKHYITVNERRSGENKSTRQKFRLIVLLVPSAALLIFVNILKYNVHIWARENLSYNGSCDFDVWFQEGYASIFIIPLVAVIGIKSNPKLYYILACFSIFFSTFLWQYAARQCLMPPDQFYYSPDTINYMAINGFNVNMLLFIRAPQIKELVNSTWTVNTTANGAYKEMGPAEFLTFTNIIYPKHYWKYMWCANYVKFEGPDEQCPVNYTTLILISTAYVTNTVDKEDMFSIVRFCLDLKRLPSHFPKVMIVLGYNHREHVRVMLLTHLETNTTVKVYLRFIRIVELLPGKWTANNFTSFPIIFEYKLGGIYYQKLSSFFKNGETDFTPPPRAILIPFRCNMNPWILNVMYWLLISGKFLFGISILIIVSDNFEMKMKYFPLVGCFIVFYMSYIISMILFLMLPFDIDMNNYNAMMFSLFIILIVNICVFTHFVATKDDIEKSTNYEYDNQAPPVHEYKMKEKEQVKEKEIEPEPSTSKHQKENVKEDKEVVASKSTKKLRERRESKAKISKKH